MDNGRGDVNTTYRPSAKNELCNGMWHTIIAIKNKNVVTLEVDGITTPGGIGEPGFGITNTNDPFYVGGVPAGEHHRGILAREQYVGCMRGLQVNGFNQDLGRGRTVGGVERSYCPAK